MEREKLGLYQLERMLGRGGMGAVYLAHDPRLSRRVALKVLSTELAREPGFKERFLTEARAVSRLNHPGITTIHEVGEVSGVHFIALELVEGETLESLLSAGALSLPRVRRLARGIADALVHAHTRGVVHRDLKPANIMVTPSGDPKILDFGLAKHLIEDLGSETDTLARLTQAGMIVGTVAYMSPEQALGESVDARADLFAFGALLYEMLAGERAFTGATPTQVLDRLLHGEPTPIASLRPDAPAELVRVVGRCLQKEPESRFASMVEVAAVVGDSDDRGVLRAPSRPQLNRISLAAAAVALALASWLFVRGGDRPPSGTDDTVAVMYFENLSDPEDSDRMARMLTQLLTSDLAASPELQVTSRQRLRDVARGLEPRESGDDVIVDAAIASRVAEASGVATMVVGQVAEAGGRIVASVELVDVASGRSLASARAQAASASDVFALASSLGEQVRRGLLTGVAPEASDEVGAGVQPLEPTESVEAYRRYVAGEAALSDGDLESAVEELSAAVAIDPAFALAQFRLSMAARWLSDAPLAHQAARRAAASEERAPSYLRDVIRANVLYHDGAYSQAIPLLRTTLQRDPDQKEALYLLGQIYVHSLRDGDPSRAIELFEHVLRIDPGFHQVYDRLALSYAFRGDVDEARRRMADWESLRPDDVEGLRSILATFEGQPEEALGFGQTFSWVEGPLFQATAAMMASRWDVARRLVEGQSDAEEWRSDALRAWALRNRAVLHTYVGEMEEATRYYRRAGAASGFRTHEGAAGGVPASALQLLAELLELSGDVGAARRETENALAMQPESVRGLYYAAKMALLDDDAKAAARHAATLARIGPASAAGPTYLAALEGEMALAEGHVEHAVERFELAASRSFMLDWASTSSSAGAPVRDGLARAYLASGRPADMERTLEALLASGPERIDHPVLYARSLYRLGVARLERGDRRGGVRLLERLLSLWGDADWELGMVEDARERLGS